VQALSEAAAIIRVKGRSILMALLLVQAYNAG